MRREAGFGSLAADGVGGTLPAASVLNRRQRRFIRTRRRQPNLRTVTWRTPMSSTAGSATPISIRGKSSTVIIGRCILSRRAVRRTAAIGRGRRHRLRATTSIGSRNEACWTEAPRRGRFAIGAALRRNSHHLMSSRWIERAAMAVPFVMLTIAASDAAAQRPRRPASEFTRQGLLIVNFAPSPGTRMRDGRDAGNALRSRIGKIVDHHAVEIIDGNEIEYQMQRAGYDPDTVFSLATVHGIGRYLRADEYVLGWVSRSP